MDSLKFRFLAGAATGALVLGTVVAPAFAASTIPISASGNEVHAQSEGKSWVFGEDNGFSDLFDGFFGRKLRTTMDGEQEVPGPGDIDGRGEAKVKIKEHKDQLCVDMEVTYIDQATAAHIHHAPAGSAGAVVVNLPIPDAEGKADGCVDVDSQLLGKIKDNPQDYYINIHNNPYPNGAIRGQLSQ